MLSSFHRLNFVASRHHPSALPHHLLFPSCSGRLLVDPQPRMWPRLCTRVFLCTDLKHEPEQHEAVDTSCSDLRKSSLLLVQSLSFALTIFPFPLGLRYCKYFFQTLLHACRWCFSVQLGALTQFCLLEVVTSLQVLMLSALSSH